jgi:hypothetical protein
MGNGEKDATRRRSRLTKRRFDRLWENAPSSLFPIPYSLFPIPYSLFPIPHRQYVSTCILPSWRNAAASASHASPPLTAASRNASSTPSSIARSPQT